MRRPRSRWPRTAVLVAGSGVAAVAQTDLSAADIIKALPADLAGLYDNYLDRHDERPADAQEPRPAPGRCYSESYEA
ncbi:MAG: hypothetical protein U0869_25285 [Chloroflexota bacterium]